MWPAIAGRPARRACSLGRPVSRWRCAIQAARNERADCHRDGTFRPALDRRSRPRGPHENGHLTTCDRSVRLSVAPEGEPPRNGQVAEPQARPGRLSSVWRCRLLRTTRVTAGLAAARGSGRLPVALRVCGIEDAQRIVDWIAGRGDPPETGVGGVEDPLGSLGTRACRASCLAGSGIQDGLRRPAGYKAVESARLVVAHVVPPDGWLTSRSPSGVQVSRRAPVTSAHTSAVQPRGKVIACVRP